VAKEKPCELHTRLCVGRARSSFPSPSCRSAFVGLRVRCLSCCVCCSTREVEASWCVIGELWGVVVVVMFYGVCVLLVFSFLVVHLEIDSEWRPSSCPVSGGRAA
jgi:hypothetical protein